MTLLYVECKKYIYKWSYLQNRNIVINVENKLIVISGERGGEGINWENENDIDILLYIKSITNKNPLYSTNKNPLYSEPREHYSTFYNDLYGNWIKKKVNICIHITDSNYNW